MKMFSVVNRMNLPLLIALVLILQSTGLLSQSDVNRSLYVGWGAGLHSRQDQLFSNVVHTAISASQFLMRYERSAQTIQTTTLSFSRFLTQTDRLYQYKAYPGGPVRTIAPHDFQLFELSYRVGLPVIRFGKALWSMGVNTQIRLWPSHYQFANAYSFGYYFSVGEELWSRVNIPLGKRSFLQTELSMPIISFVTRNPYLSQDDWFFEDNLEHRDGAAFWNYMKRVKFQSWGRQQTMDFSFSYAYQIPSYWKSGIQLHHSLIVNRLPRRLAATTTQLYLFLGFQF